VQGGQPGRASSGGAASRRASRSCTPSAASASPHSRCAARLPSENSAMRAGSSAAALSRARCPPPRALWPPTPARARRRARVSARRRRGVACLQASAASERSNMLRAVRAEGGAGGGAAVFALVPSHALVAARQTLPARAPALRALRRECLGAGRARLERAGLHQLPAQHGRVAHEVAERAGRVGARLVLAVAQQRDQRADRAAQCAVQRRAVEACARARARHA